MRERLLQAKSPCNIWDVKDVNGGLTDIAFACQYLALIHANKIGVPPRSIGEAIEWLGEKGVLTQEDVSGLAEAHVIFENVLQIGRAATGGVFDPESAGEMLCARMTSACGAKTIDSASRILTARQSMVAKIYRKVLDVGDSNPQGAHDGDI